MHLFRSQTSLRMPTISLSIRTEPSTQSIPGAASVTDAFITTA